MTEQGKYIVKTEKSITKEELEDRFGVLDENVIIYMYEEWFEKLAYKVKISNVHQTKNSIELVFPMDVVSKMDTEELFMGKIVSDDIRWESADIDISDDARNITRGVDWGRTNKYFETKTNEYFRGINRLENTKINEKNQVHNKSEKNNNESR